MTSRDAAVLTVSVAAELAGMHPQTVRQYDRLGLVEAKRTRGGGRRYSLNDVDRLLEIQRLSQEEGINLSGIAHIMRARDREDKLRRQIARLEKVVAQQSAILENYRHLEQRVFAVGGDGGVLVIPRDKLREVLQNEGRSPSSADQETTSNAKASSVTATNNTDDSRRSSAVYMSEFYEENANRRTISGELIMWRPRGYGY